MAIHRWGEGVWARGIAVAIVATFIIWGAFDFYNVPKSASVIVEKGGILDEAVIDALLEHRQSEPEARPQFPVEVGFTNQDVSVESLKGAKVAANIVSKTRGVLARQGEILTEEQLRSFTEAGIDRIPVEDRATRKVDNTLIGAITAAPVMGAATVQEVIPAGTTVADGDVAKWIAEAKKAAKPISTEEPHPIKRDGKDFSLTSADDIQAGDVFEKGVLGALAPTVLFEAEKNITEADVTTLIEAGVTNIQVRPNGMLYLDPAMGGTNYTAKNFAKFYFTAGETRSRKTWWTAQVWEIPLFGWSLTGGGITCIIVMLALLVLSWNYLNRPKLVDLLVETQLEMKKVSWPTGRELASSSIVVMAFIVFVAGWLALADYIFLALASLIGVYGGK